MMGWQPEPGPLPGLGQGQGNEPHGSQGRRIKTDSHNGSLGSGMGTVKVAAAAAAGLRAFIDNKPRLRIL